MQLLRLADLVVVMVEMQPYLLQQLVELQIEVEVEVEDPQVQLPQLLVLEVEVAAMAPVAVVMCRWQTTPGGAQVQRPTITPACA